MNNVIEEDDCISCVKKYNFLISSIHELCRDIPQLYNFITTDFDIYEIANIRILYKKIDILRKTFNELILNTSNIEIYSFMKTYRKFIEEIIDNAGLVVFEAETYYTNALLCISLKNEELLPNSKQLSIYYNNFMYSTNKFCEALLKNGKEKS